MKELINKLKVPSTSSLVLYYASSIYDTNLEKEFMNRFDFGNIEEFVKQMSDSYPNLDKILLFRKLYVRKILKRIYKEKSYPQVLSLGAGWDPLSLHLVEQYSSQVQDVFEVDLAAMVEKEALLKRILPDCDFLHFMEGDVTDPEKLITSLALSGYKSAVPTVVIFEGLIHYITDGVFRSILKHFKTPDKRNVFILDFILSDESVSSASLKQHQKCIQVVSKYVEGEINMYTRLEMIAVIEELGGEVFSIESMRDIELEVDQKNKLFPEDGDGVQEVLAFYL
ncbi:class I SAM-dependent methyltransferase [Pedobacter caeni]|uniref:Leucine carboxyl methyltransferase n=1 Tax=Pedobacter caeni TaxID=288992 RepID=A0A1M4UFA7_9SPHI|nr:class I SAM-dependent methyltransferase [Pedobacter caeni]SHE55307.1 Leucine carboxyl methyltransferase [Pedobacter caeni]